MKDRKLVRESSVAESRGDAAARKEALFGGRMSMEAAPCTGAFMPTGLGHAHRPTPGQRKSQSPDMQGHSSSGRYCAKSWTRATNLRRPWRSHDWSKKMDGRPQPCWPSVRELQSSGYNVGSRNAAHLQAFSAPSSPGPGPSTISNPDCLYRSESSTG